MLDDGKNAERAKPSKHDRIKVHQCLGRVNNKIRSAGAAKNKVLKTRRYDTSPLCKKP